MKLFQRVATIVAMSLALTGIAGVSTPGFAADITRAPVTANPLTTPVNNSLAPLMVPSPVPAAQSAVEPATRTAPTIVDSATPDAAKFASLAAAIAAQDQDIGDDTLRCLATAVYFESKSEPTAGQLAVAQVIINRTKSGRFPSDVCGVVKQRGQFSFVHAGALPTIDAGRPQYRTALAVSKVALAKTWSSTASNALFFHARRVAPGWGHAIVASIGNHIFYR